MVGNVKNRSESMQDIIARALALRNNSSSDLNSAVKAIQPLSEIVSYGAEYTYKSEDYGKFETVKVTADTKSDDIIFVTKEGTNFITFQFWDANGRQSVYGGACNGRNLVMVSNTDSQINVFISAFGLKAFRYNADGTFKNLYNGTFVQNDTVLAKYNTTEYTPTADYHPATKKYVDDAIPTSLKNPHPLIFTGATSATYDGSESVTVDLLAGNDKTYFDETVTLNETVNGKLVFTEMNGKPIKLTSCVILVKVNHDNQGAVTVNGRICSDIDSEYVTVDSLGLLAGQDYDRPAFIFMHVVGNFAYVETSEVNSTTDITLPNVIVTTPKNPGQVGRLTLNNPFISKIKLAGHGTVSFGAGTKIRIVGVYE